MEFAQGLFSVVRDSESNVGGDRMKLCLGLSLVKGLDSPSCPEMTSRYWAPKTKAGTMRADGRSDGFDQRYVKCSS